MKKNILRYCLLTALSFMAFHGGCKHQQEGIAQGRLISHSACKQFAAGPATAIAPANEQECLYYRYSGNTLHLSHQNAAFNCCPGKIAAAITVNDHTITIRENEQEAGCHCTCLFDLELEISNLPPGTYRIVVVTPHLGGQAALDFYCDLEQKSDGQYCQDRNGYPWHATAE